MPLRKRRLLGGLGQGLSDVANALLGQRFNEQRLNKQNEQAMLKETLDSFNADVKGIDPNKMGPDVARTQFSERKRRLPEAAQRFAGAEPDYDSMMAPTAQRIAPAQRRVADAKSPEEMPSEAELRQLLQSNFIKPDQMTNYETAPIGFNGLPVVTKWDNSATPELEGLLKQAEGRKSALTAERMRTTPREAVKSFDSTGTERTDYKTEEEQGALGSLQTGLTSEQAAARAAAEKRATGQVEQDVLNDPKNQAGRARGAGMEAGAIKRAQLAAELAQMGITGQQQTAALQLSDDFEKLSGEFFTIRNAYQQISKLATQDSPAADIALVFSFMKSQDPGSTVREGEQATAQNAAGIPDRIRNMYNKMMTGERLAPEQRADFARTAYSTYQTKQADQAALTKTFEQRAMQLRVPPSLVLREPVAIAGPQEQGQPTSPLDQLRTRAGQLPAGGRR